MGRQGSTARGKRKGEQERMPRKTKVAAERTLLTYLLQPWVGGKKKVKNDARARNFDQGPEGTPGRVGTKN